MSNSDPWPLGNLCVRAAPRWRPAGSQSDMQAVDCTNLRMQTVPDIKHEDTVLKKEEKKDSNSTFHSFFKT